MTDPARFSIWRVFATSLFIFVRNLHWIFPVVCLARIVHALVESVPMGGLLDQPWFLTLYSNLGQALASAVGDAAIVLVVLRIARGQKGSIKDALRGFRFVFPMTIATFISFLPNIVSEIVGDMVHATTGLVILRWLIFSAIGYVLYSIWAVATQAIIIDRLGPIAGLRRSAQLTKGHRLGIFIVTLLVVAVSYGLHVGLLVVTGAGNDVLYATWPSTIPGYLGNALLALGSAYFSVLTTVLYERLRREKDGPDKSEVAAVFD